MEKIYDVIIIGAGPAGMSAALYSSRNGLDTLVIDKAYYGGTLNETEIIDNYIGSVSYKSEDIANKMYEDSIKYGATYKFFVEIKDIQRKNDLFIIKSSDETTFKSKTVIAATGTTHKKLIGDYSNISYCALCDAPFYKDKNVLVLGAGDSAFESALYLSNYAKTVNIVHRNNNIKANKSLQTQVEQNEKINLYLNKKLNAYMIDDNSVIKIYFIDQLEQTSDGIYRLDTNRESIEFNIDGIFPCIGSNPNLDYLKNIKSDNYSILNGYLIDSNEDDFGLYLAGDIQQPFYRQVSIAVSDGTIAALKVYNYIKEKFA